MKTKRIILSLALLLEMFSIYAQEWRGFLEITAGTQPVKSDVKFSDARFANVWNPIFFGMNYTMGIRVLPQLYAGVGIGGYTSLLNYDTDYVERIFPSMYIPIFVNARWVPNLTKKINPYVDIKVGYQMGVDLDDTHLWTYYYDDYHNNYFIQHKNGLYLQPGLGVRIGHDFAFNLGLAYNVSMCREFVASDASKPEMPIIESIQRNYGFIMLTFGVEF